MIIQYLSQPTINLLSISYSLPVRILPTYLIIYTSTYTFAHLFIPPYTLPTLLLNIHIT
ncbi:hypothetical protein D3C86_842290 [compost metagenome]